MSKAGKRGVNLWQIIERKSRQQYGLDESFELRMADTGKGIDARGVMTVAVELSNGTERIKNSIITLRADEREGVS